MRFCGIHVLICLVLLWGSGCSRESTPAPMEKEEAVRRARALASMKQQQAELARLTEENRRCQEMVATQSNALLAVQKELSDERELRLQVQTAIRSEAKAREDDSVKEVKRQIAGFEKLPRSDSGSQGFRPKLALGCVVDSTEFAWVQDASNRLPKESKPRILIVNQVVGKTVVAHAYCAFRTPRGTWFAYNPTKGSQQLFSAQVPNAKEWGEELVPSATSSWFEGNEVK